MFLPIFTTALSVVLSVGSLYSARHSRNELQVTDIFYQMTQKYGAVAFGAYQLRDALTDFDIHPSNLVTQVYNNIHGTLGGAILVGTNLYTVTAGQAPEPELPLRYDHPNPFSGLRRYYPLAIKGDGVVFTIKAARALGSYFNQFGMDALLSMASYTNNLDLVKTLLKSGANVDGLSFLTNPLLLSLAENNTEISKHLIESGANLNIRSLLGETPLHLAVKAENRELAELILKKGGDINVQDVHGKTALYIAVENGNVELVKFLVENGANLDLQDKYGNYPFLVALQQDNKELVDLLINEGANLKLLDNYGDSLLYHIINRIYYYASDEEYYTRLIKLIVEKTNVPDLNDPRSFTPLMAAATYGHKEFVKYFIEKGVDVDLKNERGQTALNQAIFQGHIEVVKTLISAGANVNLQGVGARLDLRYAASLSPLILALDSKHTEIAELLIYRGADLDSVGNYPLSVAISNSQIDIAKKIIHQCDHLEGENLDLAIDAAIRIKNLELLKLILGKSKFFDPNKTEFDLSPPIELAAIYGSIDIMKMLINLGADVNINNSGTPVIHRTDSEEILELLIEAGADINATDKYFGNTLLHLLVYHGKHELAELLISKGVDVNIKNKDGMTPLDIAVYKSDFSTDLLTKNGAKNGEDLPSNAKKNVDPKSQTFRQKIEEAESSKNTTIKSC